jgi:hypothetical protein
MSPSTERYCFSNARLYLCELFLSPVQRLEDRRFGITRANRIDPNIAIFRSVVQERASERTTALLAAYTLNDPIPFIDELDALRMIEAPSCINGRAF